jgi:hypothetical protein
MHDVTITIDCKTQEAGALLLGESVKIVQTLLHLQGGSLKVEMGVYGSATVAVHPAPVSA